jgi:hypothetical protein
MAGVAKPHSFLEERKRMNSNDVMVKETHGFSLLRHIRNHKSLNILNSL